VIEPLVRRVEREGAGNPGLRAEVIAAAFIGVVMARASGAFDYLPEATDAQPRALLLDMLSPRRGESASSDDGGQGRLGGALPGGDQLGHAPG
jgi:hypothetical protein